jgi:uncharacterized protein
LRLHHISGDEVVFLYDHTLGDPPRVGDSYYVRETGADQALVVQIVALETFNYPSLAEVLMRQIMEDSYGEGHVQAFVTPANAPQVENLGQAKAKIRRRILPSGEWGIWNGYLPSRNVEVNRVQDEELFQSCGLLDPNYPLALGTTLDERTFSIAGRNFEKINVITALKGMGKSHLAKVVILQLIQQGMVSVVFDVNREYNGLPSLVQDEDGDVSNPGTIVLSASQNFRVTIEDFGRRAFIRLFEQFSPTENTRNIFELQVNLAFDQLERIDLANQQVDASRRQPRPFINIEFIRTRFPAPPRTHEAVYRAIMDKLDIIQGLNLFAERVNEASSFSSAYNLCALRGGALVVDLAPLTSRFARETFVGATLDMVERMAATSPKLPFVFFEEAHLYASGERIDNLVTRARHLGITSTFVTNMVTHLNETVLRQVDNLFLLYLPHKDDIRHVAKSATTDEETVTAFAQRIERHHAMVVGTATRNYPIVFHVSTPDGVNMAGQTRYAFPE